MELDISALPGWDWIPERFWRAAAAVYGEHPEGAGSFISFYFIFKDSFIYYMKVHCSCLQTPQKRASDLIMDGCWELNSGPSGEQSVLLTAEPSL